MFCWHYDASSSFSRTEFGYGIDTTFGLAENCHCREGYQGERAMRLAS
jgi:hypothetical protein